MKNVFQITLFFAKLKQLLMIDAEQNFRPVLDWVEQLAASLSTKEKSEAVKIAEGWEEIKSFLKKNFLDDQMQNKYFLQKETELLVTLDKIHNPENYPVEEKGAKEMSFSDKTIKNLMHFLEAELIPFQVSACG